jgi:prolyl-tRNA synthetase
MTTRLIGALVMTHGDDSGLRLPPRVAPVQAVIVPIALGNWKDNVLPAAQSIELDLRRAGIRVKLDAREEFTPGWKFSEWEMRGVPLRIEIGPKDLRENRAVAVRRDVQKKEFISRERLTERAAELLQEIQASLFKQALDFRDENTHEVGGYEEFKRVLENERGLLKAWWCGDESCEDRIKEETMATIRVIPLQKEKGSGECIRCRKEGRELVYFARAY